MGRPGKKGDRLQHTSVFRGPRGGVRLGAGTTDALPPEFDSDDPEASYVRLVPRARRRALGQFFTPPGIANVMCEWLAERQPATLLDPAVGPGILVRTFLGRQPQCRITALDVDPLAVDAARRALPPGHKWTVLRQDFLTWESDARFDAIVANPPYLRHHDLTYPNDIFAAVGRRHGLRLSRLTNAYGLFLLEICRRLSPRGRAAVIVPGEWLNANFGAPLKDYLLEHSLLSQLVYFSNATTVFTDALTTACLLFLERPRATPQPTSLPTVFLRENAPIDDVRHALAGRRSRSTRVQQRRLSYDVLRRHKKWHSLLEHGPTAAPPGFVPLGELAATCRGIATGANQYFHVSQNRAHEQGISADHSRPCVGRAADVGGLIFGPSEYASLVQAGRRSKLLVFTDQLNPAERAYLREGERQGLPERYLLAKRRPWYAMEQRRPASIWAAVFGRQELRFVWNLAEVLHLTTFHGLYPRDARPMFAPALVACLNSRTVQRLAQHQRRVYGGGLLKFEPRDLLEIPVPDLRLVPTCALERLAQLLRTLHGAILKTDLPAAQAAHDALDVAVHNAAKSGQSPRPSP